MNPSKTQVFWWDTFVFNILVIIDLKKLRWDTPVALFLRGRFWALLEVEIASFLLNLQPWTRPFHSFFFCCCSCWPACCLVAVDASHVMTRGWCMPTVFCVVMTLTAPWGCSPPSMAASYRQTATEPITRRARTAVTQPQALGHPFTHSENPPTLSDLFQESQRIIRLLWDFLQLFRRLSNNLTMRGLLVVMIMALILE